MPDPPERANWWATLPGLLTAVAGFLTALTGMLVFLNQAGIWPVKTQALPTLAPTSQQTAGVARSKVDDTASSVVICSAESDTWGRKACGATTVVFQPVYSGNDSAIITTNIGTKPIRIAITPLCERAPQCGKEWTHTVNPVPENDGSQNENLTINEPGIHEFNWKAAYE